MKTQYEHLTKYGLHNFSFSKPSKKGTLLYWVLIIVFSVLSVVDIILF